VVIRPGSSESSRAPRTFWIWIETTRRPLI
jgi:hypothetical protein